MKRIAVTSNYDDEMYEEVFLNVPPMEHEQAYTITGILNELNPEGPHYYKVVEPSYTLYAFKG